MTGLTERLSRFVCEPGLESIPQQASAIVRSGFIDTIATMIAGREEPVVGIVRTFCANRAGAERDASLLMGAARASSADAALINATAGHALDFDDVSLGGHPSTVLVPAVLAEAERLDASGDNALRAYLVGYEVWAELFAREPDSYHLKGWHPTAVLGTVGAAAAIAHLNRLPAGQCRHALALAASMASGLVANFGTMTKPLHAGRAAASAIEAVRLAAAGLTAAPDAFEHPAGFLSAISPQGRADREAPAATLGVDLRILDYGLSIKKYPTCYATHRVIDGVLELAGKHELTATDVKQVRATIGVAQASMLRNHAPVTGLEAKFSMEFAIASAIIARKVGLSELSDEFVAKPAVRDAMTKVRIATSEVPCPLDAAFALNDRVEIELQDGQVIKSGDIQFARGHSKLPLRDADLQAKFLDCTSGALDLDANGLYRQLANLGDLGSIRDLIRSQPGTPARSAPLPQRAA